MEVMFQGHQKSLSILQFITVFMNFHWHFFTL